MPSTIFYNDSSASNDNDKAILFNQFFHSVFSTNTTTFPSDINTLDSSVKNHMVNISISEADVFNALSTLVINKASGSDGIGPQILNYCAISLFKPLHYLFSLCLRKHTLPPEWLIHTIVPVYKSGDKILANNYRPIYLYCVIPQKYVLERLIYDKIFPHIHKFISARFLRNRSTVQQLLILLNNIINTKNQTDTIYLDIRKAFDTVPHNELLIKLKTMGISGNLWLWFQSYLSNRQQCVKIHNYSDLLPVLSGIPQGSILGPLLFLIYVNDIPEYTVSSTLLLFADDTKCFRTINDPSDSILLQHDIDSLIGWSIEWHLKFNPSKTIQLSFKSKIPTTYTIESIPITKVENHCDLGIMLSSSLSWEIHLKHIVSKAYKMLGLLRRSFSTSIPVNSKKHLYISLIRSQFMYCSVLWKPYLVKHIQLIERVQRRATKYILNDYISDYKSRLHKLLILPLMYTLDLNDIMFFIKNLKTSLDGFNIKNFVSFVTGNTRLADSHKLQHIRSSDN